MDAAVPNATALVSPTARYLNLTKAPPHSKNSKADHRELDAVFDGGVSFDLPICRFALAASGRCGGAPFAKPVFFTSIILSIFPFGASLSHPIKIIFDLLNVCCFCPPILV
jgi:hypothetical protein